MESVYPAKRKSGNQIQKQPKNTTQKLHSPFKKIKIQQQYQNQKQNLKVDGQIVLTLEECLKIKLVWSKKNYNNLNTWCQNTKSTLKFECKQLNSGTKDSIQEVTCTLIFDQNSHQEIKASSLAISNKIGKQNCYELITQQLIERGLLGLGFKNMSKIENIIEGVQLEKQDQLMNDFSHLEIDQQEEEKSSFNQQDEIMKESCAQDEKSKSVQMKIVDLINLKKYDQALEAVIDFIKQLMCQSSLNLTWQKFGLIWLSILQTQDFTLCHSTIEILRCKGNLILSLQGNFQMIDLNHELLNKILDSSIFISTDIDFIQKVIQSIQNSL